MKPDPAALPPAVSSDDWEAIQRSRPEDYDGHTGFDRMTPAARLAWLDAAAEFVSQHTRKPRAPDPGSPPPKLRA